MRHTQFDLAVNTSFGWSVNDDRADGDATDHLNIVTSNEIGSWSYPLCPYCQRRLRAVDFRHFADADKDEDEAAADGGSFRIYVLQLCRRCAFWDFQGYETGDRCMDPNTAVLASSVATKFEPNLPEGCSEALAQHLRRNSKHWHDLSPTRMETLVADIFRANYQHAEVLHVGGPGDRGIDVVFIDTGGIRHLIQVKRRIDPDKAESFSTLQSILGTLVLEGERHGIVVTTANYFSYQACRERERAKQRGYTIRFIDKAVLDRMLGPLLPRMPWRALLDHPSLSYLDADIRRRFLQPEIDGQLELFDDIDYERSSEDT